MKILEVLVFICLISFLFFSFFCLFPAVGAPFPPPLNGTMH